MQQYCNLPERIEKFIELKEIELMFHGILDENSHHKLENMKSRI